MTYLLARPSLAGASRNFPRRMQTPVLRQHLSPL